MRLLCVAVFTAASSASALAARPPSIMSAPSGPGTASTLHPAPWNRVAPPRSAVEIFASANAAAGSSAPPLATAPTWRNCLRLQLIVLVDRGVHSRFAERPDVFPDALRRAKHRPRWTLRK